MLTILYLAPKLLTVLSRIRSFDSNFFRTRISIEFRRQNLPGTDEIDYKFLWTLMTSGDLQRPFDLIERLLEDPSRIFLGSNKYLILFVDLLWNWILSSPFSPVSFLDPESKSLTSLLKVEDLKGKVRIAAYRYFRDERVAFARAVFNLGVFDSDDGFSEEFELIDEEEEDYEEKDWVNEEGKERDQKNEEYEENDHQSGEYEEEIQDSNEYEEIEENDHQFEEYEVTPHQPEEIEENDHQPEESIEEEYEIDEDEDIRRFFGKHLYGKDFLLEKDFLSSTLKEYLLTSKLDKKTSEALRGYAEDRAELAKILDDCD